MKYVSFKSFIIYEELKRVRKRESMDCEDEKRIRSSVIPDISVRLLDLNLTEGENGILCDTSLKKQDIFFELCKSKIVPINIRKYLLYQQHVAS